MNGAELLVSCLEVAGSETVFGVPGTQNTLLFDALRRSKLRTVLATHELGAAFQANGYARASGKPGIVTTIPGPGFMYALPGIVEALHDSAPIVMLVPRAHEIEGRKFQLQVLDQSTLAAGAFKRTIAVEGTEDIPHRVSEALRVCQAGEPGPVLVDLAIPALEGETPSQPPLPTSVQPTNDGETPPALGSTLERVLEAERMVLLLGQGSLGAAESLLSVTERLKGVVVTNSSGRGVIPEDHPRSVCGDFSGWGTELLNALVAESDLVLAVGHKFSANGSSAFSLRVPDQKLVHVDSSAEVLNTNYPASVALQMDADVFCQALLAQHESRNTPARGWGDEEVRSWKDRFAQERLSSTPRFPRLSSGDGEGLVAFVSSLHKILPRDTILTTDTGLHQTVVRRLHQVNAPRGLLIPSDFQSMGFGVPAAIGAAIGASGRRVVAVTGDGGMIMAGMELLSAVRAGVSLTVIVFNDGYLGQIRAQQIADYGHPFATDLGQVDFQALADTVGAGYEPWDGGDFDLLREVLDHEGVRIVDLKLSDGPAIRKLRAKALTQNAARRMVGERGLSMMKRWLRRFFS